MALMHSMSLLGLLQEELLTITVGQALLGSIHLQAVWDEWKYETKQVVDSLRGVVLRCSFVGFCGGSEYDSVNHYHRGL
jgi:hypothetical protein